MKGRMSVAAMLTVVWGGNLLALPWKVDKEPVSTLGQQHCQPVDFSGRWRGTCNGAPSVDIHIVQDSESVTLNYGGMKETIRFAHVSSSSNSDSRLTETHNSTAHWSCDAKVLVILGGDLFSRPNAAAHAFWSKVQMHMENGLLMVDGDYYSANTINATTEYDQLHCQYQKHTG